MDFALNGTQFEVCVCVIQVNIVRGFPISPVI